MLKTTGVKVGNGVIEAALVGVGVSGPVTGIKNWAVCDAATEWVCAMAVFMKLGSLKSGVVTPGVTQASAAIKRTKTDREIGAVFRIVPSFQSRHHGRIINYKGIPHGWQWGFFLSKF